MGRHPTHCAVSQRRMWVGLVRTEERCRQAKSLTCSVPRSTHSCVHEACRAAHIPITPCWYCWVLLGIGGIAGYRWYRWVLLVLPGIEFLLGPKASVAQDICRISITKLQYAIISLSHVESKHDKDINYTQQYQQYPTIPAIPNNTNDTQ